jgi:hypothetical protein
MPPISESRLLNLALDALEEAAAESHEGPVKRTSALRLVLAFLASSTRHGSPPPRWPYDHFWRALVHHRQQDRWANVNAALNAIYVTVGQRRDMQRVSLFERRARQQ